MKCLSILFLLLSPWVYIGTGIIVAISFSEVIAIIGAVVCIVTLFTDVGIWMWLERKK